MMNTLTRIKYFVMFLLLTCSAQKIIAANYDYINVKHIGLEEGLSNEFVNDITFDKQGFTWVATDYGLNHIVGSHIYMYRYKTSPIVSSIINKLFYDHYNNLLYCVSSKRGISIINCITQKFDTLTTNNGLRTNGATSIAGAGKGRIWIACDNGDICMYDAATKKTSLMKINSFKKGLAKPTSILDDGNGHLLVGTWRSGLYSVDQRTKNTRHYLANQSVRDVFIDHLHNVWVATSNGLFLVNLNDGSYIQYTFTGNDFGLMSNNVHQVRETKEHKLVITTDYGGNIIDLNVYTSPQLQQIKFENISNIVKLSSPNLRVVRIDQYGNIWAGHKGGGIDFISKLASPFHILNRNSEDKNNNKLYNPVYGLKGFPDGSIFVGRQNEFSLYKNLKEVKTWNILPYINGNLTQVICFQKDNNGRIWIGLREEGALVMDAKTGTFLPRIPELSHCDVKDFFTEKDGSMLIATSNGIYSVKGNTCRPLKAINSQLNTTSTSAIIRDHQGKLWVGTTSGGFTVFDQNNRIIISRNTGNNFATGVNQFLLNKKGGIWIASTYGLLEIKDTKYPHRIIRYGLPDENGDNNFRSIQEDANGNLWGCTYDDIICHNKQTSTITFYGSHNGLPKGDFMEKAVAFTPDGTLFFGFTKGACYFKIKETKRKMNISPIVIDGIIGFTPKEEGKYILGHDQNTFSVRFSVNNYAQIEFVEYEYRMLGLSKDWIAINNADDVSFLELKPGTYTFQVRAKLKSDTWDKAKVSEIEITINSPWYWCWWSILLYALLAGTVIGYAVWSYYHHLYLKAGLSLEKQKNESREQEIKDRMRFFTSITNELRTPLSLVMSRLEDLKNDKELSNNLKEKIESIHNSSMRLLNLINQLLEFRKTENKIRELIVKYGSINKLIADLGEKYKKANKNSKVEFIIDIDSNCPDIWYDKNAITTIVENLLSNAVKYTSKGHITLSLKVDNDKLKLNISDTGFGIDKESLPHIFERFYMVNGKHQSKGTGVGLSLVKNLADLHQVTIDVTSEIGKGTSFTLSFNINATYPNALHEEPEVKTFTPIKDDTTNAEFANNSVTIQDSPQDYPNNKNEKSLLVVEDNADIRQYVADIFSDNFTIYQGVNGKEGLELAVTKTPSLIISDIMMPVMDGIEMTRLIKSDIRTSHIPVVLLTAKDTIEDQAKGYEIGADSYLTKPFSGKLLKARVLNIFKAHERMVELLTSDTRSRRFNQVDNTKAIEVSAENNSNSEEYHNNTYNDSTTNGNIEKNEDQIIELRLSPIDQEFMDKFNQMINDNIDNLDLDMNFMTDKMYMSESTLYRKVKGLTDLTPKEYVRKKRIQYSMELLATRKYSAKDAAHMAGFNNIGSFRDAFKKEYGKNPSDFLKEING